MSEINYHFHLAKYDGPSSRLTCPNCGRPHCFTPYVVRRSVDFTPKNAFLSFLSRIFDEETAKSMMELYRIGTTKDGLLRRQTRLLFYCVYRRDVSS